MTDPKLCGTCGLLQNNYCRDAYHDTPALVDGLGLSVVMGPREATPASEPSTGQCKAGIVDHHSGRSRQCSRKATRGVFCNQHGREGGGTMTFERKPDNPERCPMCCGIDRGYRKQIAYNDGEYMAPCRHEWHPANRPPSDHEDGEALKRLTRAGIKKMLDQRRKASESIWTLEEKQRLDEVFGPEEKDSEEDAWVALSERSLAEWADENPYNEDDPLELCTLLAEIATAIECGNTLRPGSAGIVLQASTRIAEHDNQLGQALENYGMHWARKAEAAQQQATMKIAKQTKQLLIYKRIWNEMSSRIQDEVDALND